MPDINDKTGVPHELSLGEVFNDIKLSPAHVTALLHNIAVGFLGGPNDEMARTLMQHGNNISDPATYGGKPSNPQAQWGQPETAQQGQAAIPASGTTSEPSWMADARAAGWAASESSWMADARAAGWADPGDSRRSGPATALGSPVPARPGSDRARYYDSSTHQWRFADNGDVVQTDAPAPWETPAQTPSQPQQSQIAPQPTPPPSSPAPAYSPPGQQQP